MNKVSLVGNICRDIELKYTQTSNTAMTSFSVAVQRRFKNQNGEYETDFISVTAFGKTAEFISQYFKKGSKIGIIGRIQTRTWDDENGQKHYVTEVVAEEVEFVQSKSSETIVEATEVTVIDDTSDDLPF